MGLLLWLCFLVTVAVRSDDADDAAGKQRKKSRKSGAESSKSVKGYLDEWSEAASDWTPEPEVVTKMEALRAAVRECACYLLLCAV